MGQSICSVLVVFCKYKRSKYVPAVYRIRLRYSNCRKKYYIYYYYYYFIFNTLLQLSKFHNLYKYTTFINFMNYDSCSCVFYLFCVAYNVTFVRFEVCNHQCSWYYFLRTACTNNCTKPNRKVAVDAVSAYHVIRKLDKAWKNLCSASGSEACGSQDFP